MVKPRRKASVNSYPNSTALISRLDKAEETKGQSTSKEGSAPARQWDTFLTEQIHSEDAGMGQHVSSDGFKSELNEASDSNGQKWITCQAEGTDRRG